MVISAKNIDNVKPCKNYLINETYLKAGKTDHAKFLKRMNILDARIPTGNAFHIYMRNTFGETRRLNVTITIKMSA